MKNLIFTRLFKMPYTLAVLCMCMYGCKKHNERVGSPYTQQLAGTRTYVHTTVVPFVSPGGTSTDTATLNIQYINSGTIQINSILLKYNSDKSRDSMLAYDHADGNLSTGTVATFTYNYFTNTIYYEVDSYAGSAGKLLSTYQSL